MSRLHEKTEIVSTKRLIMIGQQVLDLAIAEPICPVCHRPGGDHARNCRVGEAMANDPVVRRQVQAAKEGNRG